MMRALSLAATLALSGCVSLLPKPPPAPHMFVLSAGDVDHAGGAPIDAVIAVATPTGERSILGSDLVWRTGDEIAYVDQAQWSARAEDALQAALVETLSRQGRFRAATRSGEANAQFEVRWEVLNFEIDGANMRARFVANVKVMQAPGRTVIAQQLISTEAPVGDRSQTVASQALTRAAREGSARIGVFAADAAAQAMAQAAATDQARAASINR